MRKSTTAITVAGISASLISLRALQHRGILPQVKIDRVKAREAVKVSRVQGKHVNPETGDGTLS